MLDIKVLGSGCANCQKLEHETRATLDAAGIAYEIHKVTDYDEMLAYGVTATPALVINEKLVSSGRMLSRSKILELVRSVEGNLS